MRHLLKPFGEPPSCSFSMPALQREPDQVKLILYIAPPHFRYVHTREAMKNARPCTAFFPACVFTRFHLTFVHVLVCLYVFDVALY